MSTDLGYVNLGYLDSHRVGFIATTQPIDTSTSTGKLLLGVLASVAEFEKALIVERTNEGLARARAQGKRLGRPPGSKGMYRRLRAEGRMERSERSRHRGWAPK